MARLAACPQKSHCTLLLDSRLWLCAEKCGVHHLICCHLVVRSVICTWVFIQWLQIPTSWHGRGLHHLYPRVWLMWEHTQLLLLLEDFHGHLHPSGSGRASIVHSRRKSHLALRSGGMSECHSGQALSLEATDRHRACMPRLLARSRSTHLHHGHECSCEAHNHLLDHMVDNVSVFCGANQQLIAIAMLIGHTPIPKDISL